MADRQLARRLRAKTDDATAKIASTRFDLLFERASPRSFGEAHQAAAERYPPAGLLPARFELGRLNDRHATGGDFFRGDIKIVDFELERKSQRDAVRGIARAEGRERRVPTVSDAEVQNAGHDNDCVVVAHLLFNFEAQRVAKESERRVHVIDNLGDAGEVANHWVHSGFYVRVIPSIL